MQRNPSHFGSNQNAPGSASGSSGDDFASIGSRGGITGRSMAAA